MGQCWWLSATKKPEYYFTKLGVKQGLRTNFFFPCWPNFFCITPRRGSWNFKTFFLHLYIFFSKFRKKLCVLFSILDSKVWNKNCRGKKLHEPWRYAKTQFFGSHGKKLRRFSSAPCFTTLQMATILKLRIWSDHKKDVIPAKAIAELPSVEYAYHIFPVKEKDKFKLKFIEKRENICNLSILILIGLLLHWNSLRPILRS